MIQSELVARVAQLNPHLYARDVERVVDTISANTIRAMEAKGVSMLTSGLDTVRAVQSALEAAGVEFLNHGRPGVRLRAEG